MVLLSGPRQVGKTTLALSLLNHDTNEKSESLDPPSGYINWDFTPNKSDLLKGMLPQSPLLIFDEIHKYHDWRNLLKGLYDQYRQKHNFIVTGSARLDIYRRGGDSLLGRYFSYRLHPFSLDEIDPDGGKKLAQELLTFGGFPEPFLGKDLSEARIWSRERMRIILREDLRDLERVQEISKIDLLVGLLKERIGQILSINSLREDIQAANDSISRWVTILENLYLIYRLPPYHKNLKRSLTKEKKVYFWDWSPLKEPGTKFENLVASHLLKYTHFLQDHLGLESGLFFLRDRDGREVDFLIEVDGKVEMLVECKLKTKEIPKSLTYYQKKLSPTQTFVVHMDSLDKGDEQKQGRIIPFWSFAKNLPCTI